MRKLSDRIEQLLDKLLLCLFAVMVAAIVWQVFARYALARPTIWSEELARYLMIWVTMLGSAYVIRHGDHVTVTVFVDLLPRRLALAVAWLRDALVVGLMGFLAWYGYEFAVLGGRRVSSGLALPMTYAYVAIPLGAALIAFFVLTRRLLR